MSQARRLFLRSAGLAIPAMACMKVAFAAERPDTDPLPNGGTLGDILKRDGRATCPLCQPGKPCSEHLI